MSIYSRFKFVNKQHETTLLPDVDQLIINCLQSNKQLPHISYLKDVQVQTIQQLFDFIKIQFSNYPQYQQVIDILAVKPLISFQLLVNSLNTQFTQQSLILQLSKQINYNMLINIGEVLEVGLQSSLQFKENFLQFFEGVLSNKQYILGQQEYTIIQKLHPLLQLEVCALLYPCFEKQDIIYLSLVNVIQSSTSTQQLFWFLRFQICHSQIHPSVIQLLLQRLSKLSDHQSSYFQQFIEVVVRCCNKFRNESEFSSVFAIIFQQVLENKVSLSDQNAILLFEGREIRIHELQLNNAQGTNNQILNQIELFFSKCHISVTQKDITRQHIQSLSHINALKIRAMMLAEQNKEATPKNFVKNYLLDDVMNFDLVLLSNLLHFNLDSVNQIKINGIVFQQQYILNLALEKSLKYLLTLFYFYQFKNSNNFEELIIDIIQLAMQNQLENVQISSFCKASLNFLQKNQPTAFYNANVIKYLACFPKFQKDFCSSQILQFYYYSQYGLAQTIVIDLDIGYQSKLKQLSSLYFLSYTQHTIKLTFLKQFNEFLGNNNSFKPSFNELFNLQSTSLIQKDIIVETDTEKRQISRVIMLFLESEYLLTDLKHKLFIDLFSPILQYVYSQGVDQYTFPIIIQMLQFAKSYQMRSSARYTATVMITLIYHFLANQQITALLESLVYQVDILYQQNLKHNILLLLDIAKNSITAKSNDQFSYCYDVSHLCKSNSLTSLKMTKLISFQVELAVVISFSFSIVKEIQSLYFDQVPIIQQNGRFQFSFQIQDSQTDLKFIKCLSQFYLKQKFQFKRTQIQIVFPISLQVLEKNIDNYFNFLTDLVSHKILDDQLLSNFQQYFDIKFSNTLRKNYYKTYSHVIEQLKIDQISNIQFECSHLPDLIESLLILNSYCSHFIKSLACLTVFLQYRKCYNDIVPYLLFLVNSLNFGNQITSILIFMLNENLITDLLVLQMKTVLTMSVNEVLTKRIGDLFIMLKIQHQNQFYSKLVGISASLKEVEENLRIQQLQQMLKNLPVPNNTLLISNPQVQIQQFLPSKCCVLKSHAKVPLFIKAIDNQGKEIQFIIKANDSVVQDHVVMLFLAVLKQLFTTSNMHLPITTYNIYPLSVDSGFIEVVNDASSLDEIGTRSRTFLSEYFNQHMSESARVQFSLSTAAYSIASYIFQFKDRHNGNIMLQSNGRLVHIDFGFVFDIAPGGKFSMERAPFKLHDNFISIMGGRQGGLFQSFSYFFRRGMLRTRSAYFVLATLAEISTCFLPGIKDSNSIDRFRERTLIGVWGEAFVKECDKLIERSIGNVGTQLYDRFQNMQNDINY